MGEKSRRRSSRRQRIRPRSISARKKLSKVELAEWETCQHVSRPRTRAQCARRPCPWVGCRFHLYVDVTHKGSLTLNFPDLEPWELPETCALDVAERGGMTLEDIGAIMNITRERVRQVEARSLLKLRAGPATAKKKEVHVIEKRRKDKILATDLEIGVTYQNEAGERRRIVGGRKVGSRWGSRFTDLNYINEAGHVCYEVGSAFLRWTNRVADEPLPAPSPEQSTQGTRLPARVGFASTPAPTHPPPPPAPAPEAKPRDEGVDLGPLPVLVPKPRSKLAAHLVELLGFAAEQVGGMPVLMARFIAAKLAATDLADPVTLGDVINEATDEGWIEELKTCSLLELARAVDPPTFTPVIRCSACNEKLTYEHHKDMDTTIDIGRCGCPKETP